MTVSPFKEKISKFMLLFSNYVRIGITTALVTHNLFQWPVPIHGTEKA